MEENIEEQRTPCQIFSRCVGYIAEINQYNPGKLSEFNDRNVYNVEEIIK